MNCHGNWLFYKWNNVVLYINHPQNSTFLNIQIETSQQKLDNELYVWLTQHVLALDETTLIYFICVKYSIYCFKPSYCLYVNVSSETKAFVNNQEYIPSLIQENSTNWIILYRDCGKVFFKLHFGVVSLPLVEMKYY